MNQTSVIKRCLETKQVVFGCTFLSLSAVMNIFYGFVIYKTRATASQSVRFQSYILANITLCNVFYCVLTLPMIACGAFLDSGTFVCSAMREAAGFLGYVGLCCAFINYFCLNLNRYVSCRYPLRYSTIVTERRIGAALVGSWLTAIVTNSLRFLEGEIEAEESVLALRKSSSHTFTVIYVMCIFTVLFFNIKLWLLGQGLYKRERNVIASIARPGDSQNCSLKTLTNNRLKATFIAFVLTVKNVILFFPYVVSIQLRSCGCKENIVASLQSSAMAIPTLSGFFDALICIFIIKEARIYLRRKFSRSNSISTSFQVWHRTNDSGPSEPSKDVVALSIIRTNGVSY